ncbi:hypothetical protein OK016_07535 [Vibrio chagasii]|nr:hypothetical protein [Vibrio chagasii]
MYYVVCSTKYITQTEFDETSNEQLVSKYHGAEIELSAPYVAKWHVLGWLNATVKTLTPLV